MVMSYFVHAGNSGGNGGNGGGGGAEQDRLSKICTKTPQYII